VTRFKPTPTKGITQLGCQDCTAETSLHFDWHTHTLLGVLAHERSCPWINRVYPGGSLIDCRHGTLMHAYVGEPTVVT
jgi:hypothetical protein